ncbi:135_t:CDS:2 [Entrophospora sp. SA101]|nr:135_t:CDS:2 [Entrophospora sp. SA101]
MDNGNVAIPSISKDIVYYSEDEGLSMYKAIINNPTNLFGQSQKIQFIEAKICFEQIRAQVEERYHVVNSEDGRNPSDPRLMNCYF